MSAVPEDTAVLRTATPAILQPLPTDIWAGIARSYSAFRSPLVPCDQDIAVAESAVAARSQQIQSGVDAVLLGVTPGLALMRWPPGSRLTAVENSAAVIGALWPGDIPMRRQAVCGSWFCIPKKRKSVDIVIGDGSLNACRFPDDMRRLIHAARELLADGALLVLRVYIRPQVQESVGAVMAALHCAGGMEVDHFKLRLWLAMQSSAAGGVSVREAARVLEDHGVDHGVMRDRCGWSPDAIGPFTMWPTSDAVYSFPTMEELRDLTSEEFEEMSVTWPHYAMGHCCPTLVMKSRE